MPVCCNFNCDNPVYTKFYRCSKCRHAKNYECSECGSDVVNNRALRCRECTRIIRTLQARVRIAKRCGSYELSKTCL
jgi:hypothetical protein